MSDSDPKVSVSAAPIDGKPRRRAVILVGNPAAPYSRAVRIARTLAREGYAVEIAATARLGLPEQEVGDGWELRRYVASGPMARLGRSSGPSHAATLGETVSEPAIGVEPEPRNAEAAANLVQPSSPTGFRRAILRVTRLASTVRRWLLWPHTVRGWWATLERQLAPADLYHACGSLTIAAALAARRRNPVGPSGYPARVIYDAIDDVMESNNVVDMPRVVRSIHRWRETAWARSADAVLTVNESLADRLAIRWRRRPIVVPNYPEVPASTVGDAPSQSGPLRQELALPPGTRIVLFLGRLGPGLGLDEAAEAILAVPDAVLVLIGFGRGYARERSRDDEARFRGRHFTLPARRSDELLAWTADADVVIVPLPPISINQRLSTPNKFWEAIASGTPVVVPESLPVMASMVREWDLGVVAASSAAGDLAAAVRTALDRLDSDHTWRGRIRAIGRERFVWPAAEPAYVRLVRRVVAGNSER